MCWCECVCIGVSVSACVGACEWLKGWGQNVN